MANKQFDIPGLGIVNLYKRRGSRSMRLSIGHDNRIRLTMPIWTPYSSGLTFIKAQKDWISKHSVQIESTFSDMAKIGKAHVIIFYKSSSSRMRSKIKDNEIQIFLPSSLNLYSPEVQNFTRLAATKALKNESNQLLPQRLETLAKLHNFQYEGCNIRILKSRWGSCNSKKQITLSCYLIQLPWNLIDYVILHELVHTKILDHGARFWRELDKVLPGAKENKKLVNTYKPVVYAGSIK